MLLDSADRDPGRGRRCSGRRPGAFQDAFLEEAPVSMVIRGCRAPADLSRRILAISFETALLTQELTAPQLTITGLSRRGAAW